MTEHKFTDEEIIRAMEHCVYTERGYKCRECVNVTGCKPWLLREALDLINRQNAELEDLRQIVFTDRSEAIKNIKAEAVKEFAERLIERAYTSSDWSHGEHPQVVECDDINEIVEELTEKGDNNEQKEN